MNEAIGKLDIIEEKSKFENEFSSWVNQSTERQAKYGNTLTLLKDAYTNTMDAQKYMTYFGETFYNGIEIIRFANTAMAINTKVPSDTKEDVLRDYLADRYKDYEPELDKQVLPVLMELYAKSVPAEYLPDVYKTIDKKFKGNYYKYAEWFYKNTKFTDLDAAINFVLHAKEKDLKKDPAIALGESLNTIMQNIQTSIMPHMYDISKGERLFMEGIIEMNPEKAFYSDANFTQRLSYGSVGGYKPADAVDYNYYSTSKGILEKENANDPEFAVQQYILNDLAKNDFGRYADKSGKMFVNFLSNNDITGGNSGSPVFDGKAQLIGLAFDGNWEALSGDIKFDAGLQRTISVDIRYVLYIIDRVMKCPRIVNELKIVE